MSDMMQEFKFVPGYDKVDCKKLFTMSTTVLVILSVIACGTSADAVPRWVCHSMACTVGVHFCSPRTRRCERCEDYKTSCSTQFQAQNCTSYCMVADCPALDPIQHGSHNATQAQRHLAVVAYSCDRGYQSSATVREVECGDYGTWSSQPKCLPIVCPTPTSPENGHIGPEMQVVDGKAHGGGYEEGYLFGQTMTVRCDKGFYLASRHTTTCGEDGHWDKIPPCYPSEPGIDTGISVMITWILAFIVLVLIMLYIAMYCTRGIRNTRMYESIDSKDSETPDKQLHQDEATGDANDQRNANETAHSWEDETIGMESPIPAYRTSTTQTDTIYTQGQTNTEQPTFPQTNTQALTVNFNNNMSMVCPPAIATAKANATANGDANRTRHSNPTAKADDTDELDHSDHPVPEDPFPTQEVGNEKPHTIPIGSEGSDCRCELVGLDCGQLPVSELTGIMKSQEGDQGHIVGAAQPDDNESERAGKMALRDVVIHMDDLGS